MEIFVETERLILRELLPTDDHGMFELDSDPEVHKYLGGKVVNDIGESRMIIASVRQQYIDEGIGRWAMIEKSTNEFLGWTGLKLVRQQRNNHVNYYDVGYRLLRRYWGNGFATESAIASLKYGFDCMNLSIICATADINNIASRRVLKKSGLHHIETFDDEGYQTAWFEITMDEWSANRNN